MTKPVLIMADLQGFPMAPEGETGKFRALPASFGKQTGLEGLGVKSVTAQSGKRACPPHNHLGKDEMFEIPEGEGPYWFDETEYRVREGQGI